MARMTAIDATQRAKASGCTQPPLDRDILTIIIDNYELYNVISKQWQLLLFPVALNTVKKKLFMGPDQEV